jgi:hypothetical protein
MYSALFRFVMECAENGLLQRVFSRESLFKCFLTPTIPIFARRLQAKTKWL